MGKCRPLHQPLQPSNFSDPRQRLGLVSLPQDTEQTQVQGHPKSGSTDGLKPPVYPPYEYGCLGARVLLGLQERQARLPKGHVEDCKLEQSS